MVSNVYSKKEPSPKSPGCELHPGLERRTTATARITPHRIELQNDPPTRSPHFGLLAPSSKVSLSPMFVARYPPSFPPLRGRHSNASCGSVKGLFRFTTPSHACCPRHSLQSVPSAALQQHLGSLLTVLSCSRGCNAPSSEVSLITMLRGTHPRSTPQRPTLPAQIGVDNVFLSLKPLHCLRCSVLPLGPYPATPGSSCLIARFRQTTQGLATSALSLLLVFFLLVTVPQHLQDWG